MCCLKAPPGEGGTVKSLVMLSSGRSSIHRNWWNRIRCFDSGFQWSDHWRAHPSLPGNRFSSPIELQVPAERESGFPPSWFKPLCRFWFVFLRCDPGVFSSHDRFPKASILVHANFLATTRGYALPLLITTETLQFTIMLLPDDAIDVFDRCNILSVDGLVWHWFNYIN